MELVVSCAHSMTDHSIHIFDGKVEIRKAFDNMVVMTRVEDGRLLKLKGTSSHAHSSAYLSHPLRYIAI
jgi:hypothetical protein